MNTHTTCRPQARPSLLRPALAALLLAALPAAHATVIASGDITPNATVWGSGGVAMQGAVVGFSTPGSVTITNGTSVVFGGISVGYNPNAAGSLTLTDTDLVANNLTVGYHGASSRMLINGGSVVSIGNAPDHLNRGTTVIGGQSSSNNITVTGQGSQLWSEAGLTVGDNGALNTLTIEDGGLVKINNALAKTLQFSTTRVGNFLQLNDGYLALFGDQTAHVASLITGGKIQLWDEDSSSYVTATSLADYSYTYYRFYEAADAQALTGYSGLGGYTILSTAAVPEPASAAALAGATLLGLAATRRRRRSA